MTAQPSSFAHQAHQIGSLRPEIWLPFPIGAGFPRRSSAESRWCAHEPTRAKPSPVNDSRAATFQDAASRGWIRLFLPSERGLGGNGMFKG